MLHYKLHLFSRNATLRQNIMLIKNKISFITNIICGRTSSPKFEMAPTFWVFTESPERILEMIFWILDTYLCQVPTRCIVRHGHLIARFFLHKVVKGREVKDSSVVLVNVVDHILGKFQCISWILDASWFAVLCHCHGSWLTLWDSILSYFQQNQGDRTYIERLTLLKS